MAGYRILIWSGAQARLIDHDAIERGVRGEALLERVSAAGRAALGISTADADRPQTGRRRKIAALYGHLREALRLIDELRPLPSARRLARRLRARVQG